MPEFLNEQGQTIARAKNTSPPPIEREDWAATLAERPWLIKGSIWVVSKDTAPSENYHPSPTPPPYHNKGVWWDNNLNVIT